MCTAMRVLDNWSEVTDSLYRFVVSCSVAYEIHALYWCFDDDILKAKANLYVICDGTVEDKSCRMRVFLEEGTVEYCIDAAINDYKDYYETEYQKEVII